MELQEKWEKKMKGLSQDSSRNQLTRFTFARPTTPWVKILELWYQRTISGKKRAWERAPKPLDWK